MHTLIAIWGDATVLLAHMAAPKKVGVRILHITGFCLYRGFYLPNIGKKVQAKSRNAMQIAEKVQK